ncbi:MAG: hypothetical protein J1E80_05635 [Desulfovibrionaceae bacterium]|nr:hypothetical protein [Desulfovibrionaceae bacterium]
MSVHSPDSPASGDARSRPAPRPTPAVARRVEELLREQLFELGVNPAKLSPRDIAEGMLCRIAPDNSLTYEWQGRPLLHVTPELKNGPEGESVLWRMFTRDDTACAHAPDAAGESGAPDARGAGSPRVPRCGGRARDGQKQAPASRNKGTRHGHS